MIQISKDANRVIMSYGDQYCFWFLRLCDRIISDYTDPQIEGIRVEEHYGELILIPIGIEDWPNVQNVYTDIDQILGHIILRPKINV